MSRLYCRWYAVNFKISVYILFAYSYSAEEGKTNPETEEHIISNNDAERFIIAQQVCPL